MSNQQKPSRVNFTVAPGSALERFLQAKSQRTASAALHELAAIMEGMKAK